MSFSNKLIAACVLTFSVMTADALPKVTVAIDSTAMEMGSRATITIDVSNPTKGGALIGLPHEGESLSLPGLPSGAIDIDAVECDSFPASLQYRLKIQAFIPGEYVFEPFEYVNGTDTFRSNHLALKVLPVELDSLETINPMATVTNEPRRWYDYFPDWLAWVILGLALAAVIVALIVLYRKNGALIIRKPKPIDPYAEAMAALESLRQRKLAENGQEKEFYTSLVDILRLYLERRFAIYAMEMTSSQILKSLRDNPETRGNQPRIKQILDIADFVKFAKVRPMPDDNIKTFNNVTAFVEETRPVIQEEKAQSN